MQICTINFNTVWKNPKANLELKEKLIKQAIDINNKVDTIVFPELSCTGFICDESNKDLAEDRDGFCVTEIQRIAKENTVNIIAGFIEKSDDDKPLNTSLVVNKKGEIITTYSKNHLFTTVKEDEIYTPGKHLSTFELDGWKCGLYICFDVRFPRLFETYKEKGVECMIGLYNWLEGEGKKEAFQYLAKARAHENQYFVVGIDRSGEDPNTGYTSSSIIATPTGKDIKETKQQIFHFGTLDKKEIKRISKFMPLQRSIKKEYNIKSSI